MGVWNRFKRWVNDWIAYDDSVDSINEIYINERLDRASIDGESTEFVCHGCHKAYVKPQACCQACKSPTARISDYLQ